MTAAVADQIRCDGPDCGRARVDYGTAAEVRRNARDYEGWAVAQAGGKDYCNACKAKRVVHREGVSQ